MEAMKKPTPPSPWSIVPQARMYRTPWALDEHGNLWREIWQGGPDGPLPPDPPVQPRPPGRYELAHQPYAVGLRGSRRG
jgi:hypothetical protein